jgi:hypothetical protein
MVYMWFVDPQTMANRSNAFNAKVEAVHKEMAGRVRPAA